MILGNFTAEILEFSRSQDEDPLDFSESLWDRTDSPKLDGLGVILPFRFTLVSRPWQQHVVLTLHTSHVQWDGISIPRLFSDFASIFNQTPLPPTTDFAQYSYYRAHKYKKKSIPISSFGASILTARRWRSHSHQMQNQQQQSNQMSPYGRSKESLCLPNYQQG
ncbi:hypothetical protein VC83_05192 [Pseudogymnoascus destructans]|uniref:Condensation domain-containing protein n=2 Tax=Pseudogymnoascus destructans TaxID=655981 RepID=L8G230_PSED2|nr:uncharacterized protein VC83_05192 [Pseudogymnoascus destructans]ELR06743.1 hypothetical protein GMDG_00360 [Pseudogymnoascus destructans 20631-21]OAF58044.1 hypothetical protein VC83_05192 [Pseudogymnoascus destructans]